MHGLGVATGRAGFEERFKVGMDCDSALGGVKFLVGDVCIAADRGEVGVAEVGGDETGISGLLAPGGGGMAERVRGD